MLKLTTSIAVTAAALMTLYAADASAATLTKKFAIQSETTATKLSAQTIVMKQNIAAVTASRGSAVMLNPQPLPPRWNSAPTKALNPQPLPPRWNSVSTKALNPQPLPPRWNLASTKALNPQPLPPRWNSVSGMSLNPTTAKALNPQPLPPRWNLTSTAALQNHKFAR